MSEISLLKISAILSTLLSFTCISFSVLSLFFFSNSPSEVFAEACFLNPKVNFAVIYFYSFYNLLLKL